MKPKTYTVIGDSVVHGAAKGETFTATLTDTEERLLVAGGHIAAAKKDAEPAVAAVDTDTKAK